MNIFATHTLQDKFKCTESVKTRYIFTFTEFPPFFSAFPLPLSSEDLPLLVFAAPAFFFGGMIACYYHDVYKRHR